jgi:soluble lytic murein transglycosylase-like protein
MPTELSRNQTATEPRTISLQPTAPPCQGSQGVENPRFREKFADSKGREVSQAQAASHNKAAGFSALMGTAMRDADAAAEEWLEDQETEELFVRTCLIASAVLVLLLAWAFMASPLIPGPLPPERVPDAVEVAILAAADQGIPPEWIVQTAWLESGMNPGARGAAGECGIFQLHPLHGMCHRSQRDQAVYAVALLARLKRQYGNWDAVRFHYTHG